VGGGWAWTGSAKIPIAARAPHDYDTTSARVFSSLFEGQSDRYGTSLARRVHIWTLSDGSLQSKRHLLARFAVRADKRHCHHNRLPDSVIVTMLWAAPDRNDDSGLPRLATQLLTSR
jgi:hypothetical protein